jgi:hypothetical protein
MTILKFMKTRREAPSGFLELLLALCKEFREEDQSKQTLLFVRVCALY